MTTEKIDIDHLRTWIGREQRVTDQLGTFPARALAAALDHHELPQSGEALPPSWHWLYFLDTPTATGTGSDGHPRKGGFLPPVPLPRRMWAAGALDIAQPLRLGVAAEKISIVRSVELKEGKSGTLVFVNLEHQLLQDDQLCIREEQNLVYRDMPTAPGPLPPGEPMPSACHWSRSVNPDPVLLFRFSALTYNGHRIHYDRDYATRAEFYPGLVVHGPLLATLLLDLVIRNLDPTQHPAAQISRFKFRAQRPTIDAGPVNLCAQVEDSRVQLWSGDHEGLVGMTASAVLREV